VIIVARVGHHEKRHRQSDSDIGLAGLLFGHWIIGAALGLALWFLRRIVGRRSA
jgi:hypothetical protein